MKKQEIITEDDAGIRLDRWFSRHFEGYSLSELSKMIRTKNIRLNGKRAEGGSRIAAGDTVSYPESFAVYAKVSGEKVSKKAGGREVVREAVPAVSPKDAAWLESMVIYKDRDIIALNKPSGLAVQGGTGQKRHLDAMLDALRFGADRPRLVHRIDKDTSGILILGRSARAAAWLTRAFEDRDIHKTYIAVVEKLVKAGSGLIKAPLRKVMRGGVELVEVDKENGLPAISKYTVLAAAPEASVLKLEPQTGRTHQLRVHCKYIGHPILGDAKYGASKGKEKLHLHALSIAIPTGERVIKISAPLPDYMVKTMETFALDSEEINEIR